VKVSISSKPAAIVAWHGLRMPTCSDSVNVRSGRKARTTDTYHINQEMERHMPKSKGKLSIPKPGKKINWKKRFWKVFSEYIRRRDRGQCFTCSTRKDYKEMDAGHYIPAGVCQLAPALYFSEKNVHCQCTACNRFKHGNLSVYAINLVRKYGPNILTELDHLKNQHTKWTDWTYKVYIDEYKRKLEELEKSS